MEPVTQGVPGYFVWAVPGQPAVVHLRVDAVDRMSADIMRGFGLVPRRGAEVGGILIGKVESGIIRIEDYEQIPCRYARGPSYLLSESEKAQFDESCRRRSKDIVGYYRSHTRDGFALQPEDFELLQQSFPSSVPLVLLVKPFATKPSVAGFFLRQNGKFPDATPLEFPFRRWEMTGEEPPRRAPLQERKRKERAVAPALREETAVTLPPHQGRIFSAEPPEPKPSEPKPAKSRSGIWLVASFVLLMLGVLLGYQASRISAPLRASDFALSLAVDRTGENLTLRWNPDALAVRSAQSATLEIGEGQDTKRVELDRANLINGSFVYRNATDKVQFRLIVKIDSGLSVSEERSWPR